MKAGQQESATRCLQLLERKTKRTYTRVIRLPVTTGSECCVVPCVLSPKLGALLAAVKSSLTRARHTTSTPSIKTSDASSSRLLLLCTPRQPFCAAGRASRLFNSRRSSHLECRNDDITVSGGVKARELKEVVHILRRGFRRHIVEPPLRQEYCCRIDSLRMVRLEAMVVEGSRVVAHGYRERRAGVVGGLAHVALPERGSEE